MRVISAGMPRTGSQSLGAAFEILGMRTYTMGICVQSYRDLGAWANHIDGVKTLDFPAFFKDYQACVGIPACMFYDELMVAFPQAKVIVCPRDAHRWYLSFDRLRRTLFMVRDYIGFLPRTRAIRRTIEGLIFTKFLNGNSEASEADCIEAYEAHNQRVRDTVPDQRLLFFTVDQGWEPLCAFLEVPVPDVPFPHINKSDSEVKKNIGKAILRDVVYVALAAGFLFAAWKLLSFSGLV